ncbi:MAG TPA: HAD family hydrolase [Vicinamibacterales bacterium]|nr:HAD family hydrolase [Vicinamibacterales bacterium]
MPGPVRAVLADLDDTLFDHRHATRRALAALAAAETALTVWSPEELDERHASILEHLHTEVLAGRRTIADARRERFTRLLREAGAAEPERRGREAAAVYRPAYERAWRAVPGALALVEAVAAQGVPLAIVTNNGVAEQRRKLARVGLERFVHVLVTSEQVGVSKPGRAIFEHALAAVGVEAADAVMIGDAWTSDVVGARTAGIRAVWFNRLGLRSPDPDVAELASLEPRDEALRAILQNHRGSVA